MPAYTTLKFRSFTNNSEDTKACANTKAWFRSLIYFMNRMCIAGKFTVLTDQTLSLMASKMCGTLHFNITLSSKAGREES